MDDPHKTENVFKNGLLKLQCTKLAELFQYYFQKFHRACDSSALWPTHGVLNAA